MKENRLSVENRIAPASTLIADRALLRIVYDNLLSNAIKYGRAGGKVVLDSSEGEKEIVLSVLNEGDGIPTDKMAFLLKKFSRVPGSDSARKKGTGLGLFICKEIVEKHRGRIWAESQVGAWTRFVIALPVRAVEPSPTD